MADEPQPFDPGDLCLHDGTYFQRFYMGAIPSMSENDLSNYIFRYSNPPHYQDLRSPNYWIRKLASHLDCEPDPLSIQDAWYTFSTPWRLGFIEDLDGPALNVLRWIIGGNLSERVTEP